MNRLHRRLDKIEADAASKSGESIEVWLRSPPGDLPEDAPEEVHSMEEPMQHTKTGRWRDAATVDWEPTGCDGVRVSFDDNFSL